MEKKEIKFWKKVLWVIVAIVLIFAIFVIRNLIIVTSINEKCLQYQSSTNVYSKLVNEKSTLQSLEKYLKGDKEIYVLTQKDGSAKVTMVRTPNKTTIYTQTPDKTTVNYSEGSGMSIFSIANYLECSTLFQKIYVSMFSKITTEVIDGTEYYVVTSIIPGMHPFTAVLEGSWTEDLKLYIEKETGLTSKLVETVNENEQEKQYSITYEYEFNKLTDGIMEQIEPDIT